MATPHLDLLHGLLDEVPTDSITRVHDDRNLDRLTHEELVDAVAAVIARPREEPADSFVLHAPLELTARARLLALLDDAGPGRRLARLRLVSIAARYEAYAPAALPDRPAGIDPGAPAGSGVDQLGAGVVEAIAAGDLERVDGAVQALADGWTGSSRDLDGMIGGIGGIGPAIAARTAAAAHGPIFLATLTERPDRVGAWLPMLRPLARELARRPDWRLDWFDRVDRPGSAPTGQPDVDGLFRVLADPPRLGAPGSTFVHPTMQQVDAPGVADELLGPVAGPGRIVTPAASNAITRVAALAMARDTPERAPYGWTHTLTLPQAILTLAPWLERAGVPALAIAATHVLGFRASLAEVTLDPHDELIRPADPTTAPTRRARLAIEAARRHDAHVAKYVLAALTQADRDPEAGHLHLTAAERLLAVWDSLGPDPDDLLADEVDRL